VRVSIVDFLRLSEPVPPAHRRRREAGCVDYAVAGAAACAARLSSCVAISLQRR
jgi:hypothetical protein